MIKEALQVDVIGMGWLSYAIGLLNAPSVLITNVGKVPCTDKQPLTADVCYVRSTDVFRDSVNCIPCIHLLCTTSHSPFLFPIYLFCESFTQQLSVPPAHVFATCCVRTWMNLQTVNLQTELEKQSWTKSCRQTQICIEVLK